MLKIEISEPADLTKTELRALSTLFLTLAGDVQHDAPTVRESGADIVIGKPSASHDNRRTVGDIIGKIAAEDNPSTGVDAAEIFAGGANPVDVFGIGGSFGKVDAVATMPDPAAVFAGNVPAAPLPIVSLPVNVAAPVPSIAPAPVPSGATVELDSAGLPWDGRIHAASKARILKDNTWKKRRGVDDREVATVEAELRAVLAAPVPLGNVPPPPPPPPAPLSVSTANPVSSAAATIAPPAGTGIASSSIPAPPVPAASPIVSATTVAAPVSVPNVPPPPTLPVASHSVPVGVTVASAAPAMTFPQLVPKVTLALANKTITEARLKQILDHYGLPSIPSLVQRADLVPLVHDALFPAVA